MCNINIFNSSTCLLILFLISLLHPRIWCDNLTNLFGMHWIVNKLSKNLIYIICFIFIKNQASLTTIRISFSWTIPNIRTQGSCHDYVDLYRHFLSFSRLFQRSTPRGPILYIYSYLILPPRGVPTKCRSTNITAIMSPVQKCHNTKMSPVSTCSIITITYVCHG